MTRRYDGVQRRASATVMAFLLPLMLGPAPVTQAQLIGLPGTIPKTRPVGPPILPDHSSPPVEPRPALLMPGRRGEHAIAVRWKPSTFDGVVGYRIRCVPDCGEEEIRVLPKRLEPSVTAHTFTGLQCGCRHRITLETLGPDGVRLGAPSVVSLATGKCPPDPVPAPALPSVEPRVESPTPTRAPDPVPWQPGDETHNPTSAHIGGAGVFVWRAADSGYESRVKDALDDFNRRTWGYGAPGASSTRDASRLGFAVRARLTDVALVGLAWEPMNYTYTWPAYDYTFRRETHGRGSGLYLTLGKCVSASTSHTLSLEAGFGVVEFSGEEQGRYADGHIAWSQGFGHHGTVTLLGATFQKHAGNLALTASVAHRFCTVRSEAVDGSQRYAIDLDGTMLRLGVGLWGWVR